MARTKSNRRGLSNSYRIIGGCWRGRRLAFPSAPLLRPSSDRVRETLFNWLATPIVGARCLDLFAGSGALGFEALSRGAQYVTFVEQDVSVGRQLAQNISALEATNSELLVQDALDFLKQHHGQAYDIVFLDPPFRQDFFAKLFPLLENNQILAKHGLLYVEAEHPLTVNTFSADWVLSKQKQAGKVCYGLLQSAAVTDNER